MVAQSAVVAGGVVRDETKMTHSMVSGMAEGGEVGSTDGAASGSFGRRDRDG